MMNSRLKNIALNAIIVVATLVILEILLQLLALAVPSFDELIIHQGRLIPNIVSDPRLGHRPNPKHPEHDIKGFRNTKLPDEGSIVCMGDSQTYGMGVAANQSWPRQLENLIESQTYSMAYGGYGPVHSLVLFDEAVALKPKMIIEAFYAGNDLYDSFNIVYNKGQHSELKIKDKSTQRMIEDKEKSFPIIEHIERLYKRGKKKSKVNTKAFKEYMAEHSKLYGLVRAIKRIIRKKRDPVLIADQWKEATEYAERYPDYYQVFSHGAIRTVFASTYRSAALDLSDIRINEGLGLSLRAIRQMQVIASKNNIEFLVLFIPTKEYVFADLVNKATTDFYASYQDLIKNEASMWRQTREYLEKHNIKYIDALPALRKALSENNQPYGLTRDGHPNEFGHKVIAKSVKEKLSFASARKIRRAKF